MRKKILFELYHRYPYTWIIIIYFLLVSVFSFTVSLYVDMDIRREEEEYLKVYWNSSFNVSYANHAVEEGVTSKRRNRKRVQ
jgi:hypothetical protein